MATTRPNESTSAADAIRERIKKEISERNQQRIEREAKQAAQQTVIQAWELLYERAPPDFRCDNYPTRWAAWLDEFTTRLVEFSRMVAEHGRLEAATDISPGREKKLSIALVSQSLPKRFAVRSKNPTHYTTGSIRLMRRSLTARPIGRSFLTSPTARKYVEKAAVPNWDKFWNSFRASAACDLMDEFGLRKSCAWMGHSAAVALKNYNLTKATDFQDAGVANQAASGDENADKNSNANSNAAPARTIANSETVVKENDANTLVNAVLMGAEGLEPPTLSV